MSDDENNKPVGIRLPAQAPVDLDALTKSTRDAYEQMTASSRAIGETMRQMTENLVPKGFAEKMAKLSQPATDPSFTRITDLIDGQMGSIKGLRLSQPSLEDMGIRQPRIPHIEPLAFPPNPGIETNERLDRIEQQFASMSVIATQGAEIATQLQAYAAQFLQRFEQAAKETDRSARKAIWISISAIVLTAAAAVLPIAYDLVWQSPEEAASQAEALEATGALKTELSGLRADQQALFDRLETALAQSGPDPIPVLQDIRDLLVQLRDTPQAQPATQLPTSVDGTEATPAP